MTATEMRAGEAAAAAGVHLETLRYYERRGLLPTPDRTLGGHRIYTRESVMSLRVIRVAQRLGFTLREISDLLETARHRRHPHSTGLHASAVAKLAEVERKIADLEVIRDSLRAAIDAGCDDLATCSGLPDCPLPFSELAGPAQKDRER
jgi:MerR family mercuric resistance operon transcriptional regulator